MDAWTASLQANNFGSCLILCRQFQNRNYFLVSFSDVELQDPLRYLISRPLFGILMGTLIYLAVRVGFITAAPGNQELSLGKNELVWLISFLVGFSDRFSDEILKSLIGRLGGDDKNELITPTPATISNPNLNLLDVFQGWGKQIGETAKKLTSISGKILPNTNSGATNSKDVSEVIQGVEIKQAEIKPIDSTGNNGHQPVHRRKKRVPKKSG